MNYINLLLPSILEGLNITLSVFFITLLFSIPLGILVSLAKLSKIKFLSYLTNIYIWIMRGTPLLLQLVIIFFGLPLIGIRFDRFDAAIVAFVLNYTAYFAEIFRGGVKDIDKGQFEAAEILGLSKWHTFKRIILPQTMKKVLPSITNEVITLIKDTSLVYVVGLGELLRAGKIASNRDASLVPLFVVAAIYLLLIAILTQIFLRIEKKYSYYR